jgi:hypothetical protein
MLSNNDDINILSIFFIKSIYFDNHNKNILKENLEKNLKEIEVLYKNIFKTLAFKLNFQTPLPTWGIFLFSTTIDKCFYIDLYVIKYNLSCLLEWFDFNLKFDPDNELSNLMLENNKFTSKLKASDYNEMIKKIKNHFEIKVSIINKLKQYLNFFIWHNDNLETISKIKKFIDSTLFKYNNNILNKLEKSINIH